MCTCAHSPANPLARKQDYENLILREKGSFSYFAEGISGDGGGVCGSSRESTGTGSWWLCEDSELVLSDWHLYTA